MLDAPLRSLLLCALEVGVEENPTVSPPCEGQGQAGLTELLLQGSARGAAGWAVWGQVLGLLTQWPPLGCWALWEPSAWSGMWICRASNPFLLQTQPMSPVLLQAMKTGSCSVKIQCRDVICIL